MRSHSNGAFSSIFLKLRNYVRSECILIICKFVCHWKSSFVFINEFHKLFAQPSYITDIYYMLIRFCMQPHEHVLVFQVQEEEVRELEEEVN